MSLTHAAQLAGRGKADASTRYVPDVHAARLRRIEHFRRTGVNIQAALRAGEERMRQGMLARRFAQQQADQAARVRLAERARHATWHADMVALDRQVWPCPCGLPRLGCAPHTCQAAEAVAA